MNEATEFLSEYGGPMLPIVAFEQIGNTVRGKILTTPRVKTQTMDNVEQKVLAISLEVIDGTNIPCGKAGERRPAQVGEHVALWIKAGGMASALGDAVNRTGGGDIAVGGTLAMRYTGDGQRSGSKSPPKQYQAAYTPPVQSVGLDDLLGPTGPTGPSGGTVVTTEELF